MWTCKHSNLSTVDRLTVNVDSQQLTPSTTCPRLTLAVRRPNPSTGDVDKHDLLTYLNLCKVDVGRHEILDCQHLDVEI